jgi:hypothetical protein
VHAFWSQGVYLWTVTATDGILTTPSLDIFSFTIRRPTDVGKEGTPIVFALYQNYPNPVPVGRQGFNPITTITYTIGHQASVSLKVFDVLGREVATLVNEVQGSAYGSVGEFKRIEFNALSLSSGVYYYQLQAEGFAATKRMFVIR